MIKLLIIDDHTSFRGPLAALLSREEDIEIAGQAGTVAEALELVEDVTFNAALVDLSLPDGDGLDLLPAMAQVNPDAALIVLTGAMHGDWVPMAIAAGAIGFIHKTSDADEIIRALRTVHDGHALISPVEAMRLVRQAADIQSRAMAAEQGIAVLSPRELDVLKGIAAGLDNQEIGQELNLGTNTVRTHVAHVLNKLGVHSRLQAALLAVKHGVATEESFLHATARQHSADRPSTL